MRSARLFSEGLRGSFDLTMKSIDHLKSLGMPLQINTVISNYNIDYLEEMAALMEELECVLWSVFFLVPIGRGQRDDMISPADHERVFRWLYDTQNVLHSILKQQQAQHYRRVVTNKKCAKK